MGWLVFDAMKKRAGNWVKQEKTASSRDAGDAGAVCGFRWRDSVLDCGSPLPLSHRGSASRSGRGLPQSKSFAKSEHPADQSPTRQWHSEHPAAIRRPHLSDSERPAGLRLHRRSGSECPAAFRRPHRSGSERPADLRRPRRSGSEYPAGLSRCRFCYRSAPVVCQAINFSIFTRRMRALVEALSTAPLVK